MNIGIDFDDVITDFTEALMSYYHKRYGKKVNLDQILIWDWGLYWGVLREEAIKRVDEYHESHKVAELPPLKDAISSLKKLLKKHKVFIITGRPVRFQYKVEEWLQHHLNKRLEVIHAGEFHIGRRATKAEICKELSIPLIIEDVKETALSCAEAGIKVILFNKPWNKNFHYHNVYRVDNWHNALNVIEKLNSA